MEVPEGRNPRPARELVKELEEMPVQRADELEINDSDRQDMIRNLNVLLKDIEEMEDEVALEKNMKHYARRLRGVYQGLHKARQARINAKEYV